MVNGLAVWQNGDKSILFGGLYWLIKDDTSSEFAHYSAVPDLNSYCPYKFNDLRSRDLKIQKIFKIREFENSPKEINKFSSLQN